MEIKGIRLAAGAAGIRYPDRDDLVLIELGEKTGTAAVFTQNAFCAAPVSVAKTSLARTAPRYLLINSGNANAGTGDEGLRTARETCRLLAGAAGCAMEQVLPFSTGVIGEDLPVQPFAALIPELLRNLDEAGWDRASRAIMTTDTVPKLCSRSIDVDGRVVTVTGMAKGSGMIHPDMATLLVFVATDAGISPAILQDALTAAVAPSFN